MTDEMHTEANQPATKGDMTLMKGDMSLLKSDVTLLKDDLGLLRGEFKVFRVEMREMLQEMLRPIFITLANHTAELADIRGYMRDKLVTRDEFHSRMDGFTGRVDDFDYSSAKNRDRLDQHEKRISALEAKRRQ